MQTKSKIALYVIIALITIAVIIGCIYEKQQYKTTIHKQNKTKQNIENKIETETYREVDTQAKQPVNLGKFKLTGYCSCAECCSKWAYDRPDGIVYGAIGEELKEGYSIAVDPNVIPYNSEVIINGKTYEAQDCGGAIKGDRIDVYFEDHDKALEFGVQYAEIFVNL